MLIVVVAAMLAVAFAATFALRARGLLRRAWHWDVAAVAIIALAVVGCFWRAFFVPGYWLPEGGGDNASTLLPFYRFAAEELRAGRLPLWNPYLYGGAPFAGDIQSAVFYPINWLTFLIVPEVTYAVIQNLALFHVALAGVGVYALAAFGRIGGIGPLNRAAALVGAISFMLCDYFIVHLGNLNLVAGAAWLPWAALGVVLGISRRNTLAFALGGLALALSLLAGHIQPFLYGLLLAGGLALFGVVQCWRAEGWRAGVLLGVRALAAPAVALGLAWIQFAASLELQSLTGRASIDYDAAIAFSLPPAQLLSLVVPDLFGRGPGSYWGSWPRVEMGYFGILPLLAVAVALALRRRQPVVWFLAGFAVFGLLMALGGYTVVYGWFYRFAPGFGGIRAPARAIVLFNLATAWLAAIGVDAALAPLDDARRVALGRITRWSGFALLGLLFGAAPPFVFFLVISLEQPGATTFRLMAVLDGIGMAALLLGGAALLFGLRASGRIVPRVFAIAVVVWAGFDLLSVGFDVEGGGADPMANYRHPEAVAFLKSQQDSLFRIDTETGVWDVWQPASGLYHRIADVRGVDNPLMLADTQRYWAELGGRNGAPYDLLNVRYVLGHKDVELEPSKFELAFDGDPTIAIYRNRTALPRYWLVPRAQVVADHEAAFAAVHSPGFDPRQTVVLEQSAGQPGGAGEVQVQSWQSGRSELKVSAPSGGYLAASETYYPGWQATIDGKPAEILRADFLFRAIVIPPGEHTLVMQYRPGWLVPGVAVSLVTLSAVIVLFALQVVAARRPVAQSPRPAGVRAPEPVSTTGA